jgi:CDP-diacylglycerol--glycerol-3-phosphate 3-phosphatidyltransferase
MGALDAVDGTMARLRGEPTAWGAFIDSVADRYSELFVYIGLSVYFLDLNDRLMLVMTFLAATGSVMVSYTRARALSLGYEIKTGILTRMERYFILTPTVIIGYPQIGVVIIGIFANLTALQRVMAMRRLSGGSKGE